MRFEAGDGMLGIYQRAKNHAGAWRYSKVAEGRGVRTSLLKPPFYARPTINGKQSWSLLNATTLESAKEEAAHLETGLAAQAKGLTVVELDATTNAHRIPLKSVIERYLDLKKNKAKKTVQQYRLALEEFGAIMAEHKVRFLDAVTVDALRLYADEMTKRGFASKTLATRLNVVYFMLKKNGVEARVPNDELPAVEEEAAVPYTENEIKKLFAAMDREQTELYKFFLGTAARSGEVMYAAWQDIDFEKGLFHVRRKSDVGFNPKSHESRTIKLPAKLVEMLKERKKRMPQTRWIFGGKDREGKEAPGNHFLRKLKNIALNARMNCGQCRTTITQGEGDKREQREVCCATYAVCQHFYLHRFRKTCATRWHENGVPVRTLQHWLGHKSLETTQKYLGISDSEKLSGNVDAAFG
jgi:integrase